MEPTTDGIVLFITASSREEASTIATALVEEHLVACVNIAHDVRSLFFWQGKTEEAQELLLICKSRRHLLDRIIDRVKALHSYSVPEIIAMPIIGGSPEYLAWLRDSTVSS